MRMSDAVDYIRDMEHGIIIAVGSGKQGKSCSIHSLANLCWPNRGIFLMDPLDIDIGLFPGYRKVSKPSEVPVGSVVILDDVNRVFPSRGSSKDNTLQKWLGIISHKSTVVCITTQSLADTDIGFMRSQDCIVMNKTMCDEDVMFERPEFRVDQAIANHWISEANRRNPKIDRRSWCYFPRFSECVAIPKVWWWGYGNSHMLRDVVI